MGVLSSEDVFFPNEITNKDEHENGIAVAPFVSELIMRGKFFSCSLGAIHVLRMS